MATTYFKIITIGSRLRIRYDDHTAIPGKVRFNNIARIILVGSKVTLNMAALVKILGCYTIIDARSQD